MAYAVSGEITSDGSFEVAGNKNDGRGSLYDSAPSRQIFILKRMRPRGRTLHHRAYGKEYEAGMLRRGYKENRHKAKELTIRVCAQNSSSRAF